MNIFAVTGNDVVRFTLTDGWATDAQTVLAHAGARCVAVDPGDPRRVYVGTFDSGTFSSDDGGESWRTAEEGLEDERVLSLGVSSCDVHSGTGVVYAGTEPSNLYRSEDGGRRWERLSALRDLPSKPTWSFPPRPWTHHVSTIALHPTDPGGILVGIELGGVMRSRDRGASWIDHNREAHRDAHRLLTHPLARDRVYEIAGQGIAVSDDRGDTWRRDEEGLDRHYAWVGAIDPDDPDLWYASISRSPYAAHGGGDGQARLLRQEAKGGGWTPIDGWGDDAPLRRMPYAITTLPGRHGALLVGLRGGTMLLTTDAGDTWSRLALELSDVVDMAAAP
ncbi:MAG: hypothetical protein JOZ98_01905 [Solirubrobacterales bacterium]|nr:hypothetical protein [Solirubrobacterales bacterium]